LLAASKQPDADRARDALLERCVVSIEREGAPVPVSALPEEVIQEIGAAMALADPQSEIWLSLNCPNCGETSQVLFDVAEFTWREIEARARQLLMDVHTLALAYGWREEEILSMPAVRRQAYLELLGA
jgi:hypothetical protein